MRKQIISLIGSTSLVGRCFDQTYHYSFIRHPNDTLDWNKPEKTLKKITKGNPDAYVICYSALDEAESRLLEILRVVKKAAKKSKAKIIGFITPQIFQGSSVEVIDEGIEPFATTDKGRAEILYQEKLLDYSNSVAFRIGRVWGIDFGIVYSYLKRMCMEGGLEILRDETFSMTSANTIVSGVITAAEKDLVLYYNLVDRGKVKAQDLSELIQERASEIGHLSSRRKIVDGGECLVLDGLRWEVMSMTEAKSALSLVKDALPAMMGNMNADK